MYHIAKVSIQPIYRDTIQSPSSMARMFTVVRSTRCIPPPVISAIYWGTGLQLEPRHSGELSHLYPEFKAFKNNTTICVIFSWIDELTCYYHLDTFIKIHLFQNNLIFTQSEMYKGAFIRYLLGGGINLSLNSLGYNTVRVKSIFQQNIFSYIFKLEFSKRAKIISKHSLRPIKFHVLGALIFSPKPFGVHTFFKKIF